MGTPKVKVTKKPPAPSSNITGKPGKGGATQAQALGSLQNSKGQMLKDVLKESFSGEQVLKILSDPKQMEKIIPSFFAGIMSLEKLFVAKEGLNIGSTNTLLGIGKGNSGGYGGHPIEGYLQFKPEETPPGPPMDPTKDPRDPTKNKPGRIDLSSNNKFIKVSQQAETNEYEFLKASEHRQKGRYRRSPNSHDRT